jgi:TRAP-type C4-dicarboxylate transport system substrate-binding protein
LFLAKITFSLGEFVYDFSMLKRCLRGLIRLVCGGWVVWSCVGQVAAQVPAREIRVVGSLASIGLYTQFEEPFWTQEFPALTQGGMRANIVPFDQAGIRGQDMLKLMQVGTVPMGTALFSLVASQEPRLGLFTLAGMTPDSATLREALTAFRPHMDKLLRERYGIEPLAVYIYPAQVVFCRGVLSGLADLKGRKIRTSSLSQSDLIQALGGIPVQTPFNELVATIRAGRVDCAITGTISGNNIGLDQVTTHMLALPINWGGAFFGVNSGVWASLPAEMQSRLRQALTQLERRVWAAEVRETQEGMVCNSGQNSCTRGRKGNMTVVAVSAQDRLLLKKTFEQKVLPRWIDRCADACVPIWNDSIGKTLDVKARMPARQ